MYKHVVSFNPDTGIMHTSQPLTDDLWLTWTYYPQVMFDSTIWQDSFGFYRCILRLVKGTAEPWTSDSCARLRIYAIRESQATLQKHLSWQRQRGFQISAEWIKS